MVKIACAAHRFVIPFSVASCCLLIGPGDDLGRLSVVDAALPNALPSPQVTAQQVNEALGLRESKIASLNITSSPANQLSVMVPLGNELAQLELEPHSVRSSDYRVEVHYGDGTFAEVPAGPVRTYRGRISGMAGSAVAAFKDQDGLHARVLLADGEQYWVEPIAPQFPGTARSLHAVYRNNDVIPSMAQCDAHDGMRLQQEAQSSTLAATGACGTGLCIAEIACDADVEFYLNYGSSVSAVEDRINAIINSMNIEYERDVDIRHVISTIIVREAEPDPYTATAANPLLTEFRNHWLNNHSSVQRDTAELFTGKDIDNNVIGIAWVGAICGSYGFSVVQSDCCNSFACATDLSAHELGHNWNAGHCACAGTPSWTMNPYITCANQFHPTLSIPVMTSFRDSRTCLTAGSGGCTSNLDCDDANACTDDVCSSGTCTHSNKANGTACGSSATTDCGNPDTCSNGACVPNNDPSGTLCTDDGNLCTNDACDGSGSCTHPAKANGTECGSSATTDCDNPDTCSGGACVPNYDPSGTLCTDDGNSCTNDTCNGSGSCQHVNNSNLCTDDGDSCTTDSCSAGVCQHVNTCNLLPTGASCTSNSQCASNSCRGKRGQKTCR